jgi:hypothetical protein
LRLPCSLGLNGPRQEHAKSGYVTHAKWFVWGNDANARFYKEPIDGHRYR